MRIWISLAASTLLLPTAAMAQSSVTLYGIVDAAVAVEDTGAPGGKRTLLNSGNQSSSRFGIRGREDLGSGLTAVFNLESGFALDSGQTDAVFFGRRSVVGLEGPLGSLYIGREYSPIAAVAGAADVFGQGFYGTNLSAFTTGRLTRRLSNAITYRTPSLGGFKASFVASPSERAAGASRVFGTAVEYTAGSFYAGAGYHDGRRDTGATDKEYGLGIGYVFGGVDVKANYLAANPAGAGNKFEQFNVGAAVGLGGGRLFGNMQQNRQEAGAKGTALAASYSYPLSKRTNVYTSYARLRNNTSGRFGLSSSSTSITPPATSPGADPSVVSFGVRHIF